MIVPTHWAEARRQHKEPGRQVTVRRFGWSDASQADAQAMADQRAAEALARVLSGEKLPRREPKVPYNGADGLPIREEVVSRHGEAVVTRNSYGARCLNTPDVLIADVDFPAALNPVAMLVAVLLMTGGAVCWLYLAPSFWQGMILLTLTIPLVHLLDRWFARLLSLSRPPVERRAMARLSAFAEANRSWNLRVYRTPAGLRAIATHDRFDPAGEEAAAFFLAIGADPTYARMCRLQRCFRARVSAKPWRAGIESHIRPRPGVWPVADQWAETRRAWVDAYEAKAAGFAACRFVEEIGSGRVEPAARRVVDLHDKMSHALVPGLPLA
jgi:hypothetical protein